MSSKNGTKVRLDAPPDKLRVRIRRREKTDSPQYDEVFEIPYRRNLNVISVLMDIRKNPVTADGKETTPPVWDMNCLEQVCGICTMVINGRVRQSCSALIDDLLVESGGNEIRLEPMSKFPNVRDLKVDRSPMFDHLKKVHAWVELDGYHDLGAGPHTSQSMQAERYAYSRCMTCGCCLEACPQYFEDNYIGPQAIGQVRLFNMHPTGQMDREERLDAMMDDDGIANCGNSQNCVQVCPMNIPLTRAIYETNREVTVHGLFGWLKK
ncbi:MAG: succinate dehydrogenase iron-sulfur subunit [Acidobacteria bacterium]|nr:MAG: succinate dehydrogenase iron-sulfur subunit [Acidobacteriota bacterium]REK02008.1 MAG: succinate dehydrogenase iron-sulfur subunit [Acidobacteriota bacterium]REK14966.1 MAG: succinate dehydrogenase iron-sulfur subunit [Acidobacteriota bacterium]REK45680.1 MAG: succinate dehydrogenase iron-sulfur subunit [Acidobacteriota bacterium]